MTIFESRMGLSYYDYLHKCMHILESMSDKGLLQGLGELMDNNLKNFVRIKLWAETIGLLRFYKDFPILS